MSKHFEDEFDSIEETYLGVRDLMLKDVEEFLKANYVDNDSLYLIEKLQYYADLLNVK